MTKNTFENDKKLIEDWQKGDDKAFEAIFKQNNNKVIRSLCRNLGVSVEMAEEAFNEAMVVLHEAKYKFEIRSLLSTYLYQVASHKCIDERRKPPHKISQQSTEITTVEDFTKLDHLLSESPDFYEDMILQRAFEQLEPKPCKEIFILQYWHQQRLNDIAKQLNRNESYIRRRVKECEQYLKVLVEQLKKMQDD
jgi:RNA polymerase sigma factor (sigma-70 family)